MELPNSAWEIAFILAFTLFVCALILAFVLYRKPRVNNVIRPFPIVIAATFIATLILSYPVYLSRIGSESSGMFDAIVMAIQSGFYIFSTFNPNELFYRSLDGVDSWVVTSYLSFNTLLNLLAPLLLLSFLLSFIKGLKAYLSYLLGYQRDVYIFSKLSDISFTLAKSVAAHYAKAQEDGAGAKKLLGNAKPLIVFTDVNVENSKTPSSLYQSAVDMRFICFKNDILSVRFDIHSKKAPMNFVIIGEDRNENHRQALRLLDSTPPDKNPSDGSSPEKRTAAREKPDYSSRKPENTCLYVFDSSKESELLLDGKRGAMTIRRINRVRQFVHNFLWDYLWDDEKKEHILFSSAVEAEGRKHISILLVGLGKTGSTLLKTLSWYGQMDGFDMKIHAIDRNPNAEKRLRFECPELFDDAHNHNSDPNESIYSITVHAGIDVESTDFSDLLSSIAGDTTFAFVSLGDDELNVETAANLRILFKRVGHEEPDKPLIYAVVHNSEKVSQLINLLNYSDDDYNIDLVGDNLDLYSYQMVFDPRLEDLTAQRHIQRRMPEDYQNLQSIMDKTRDHKQLTAEESREAEMVQRRIQEVRAGYWNKEYFRNSSMSRFMHERVVDAYGPSTPDEVAQLESRRWNAYMRSEGFVYNEKRNDLAKQHHMLIPYDEKPQDEQAKDYRGFKQQSKREGK